MSHVGVITSFSTGTYTVTRTLAGSYTAGRYAAGAVSTFDVVACVQPVSGRDLQSLPEAQRGDEVKVVYCATELRTRTPAQEPDTVAIEGESYEVFRVERWDAFGEVHWRAYTSRLVTP